MIFVFGARRSGTYWLDRILSAHPLVTEVPSETHLFHRIAQLVEQLHHGGRDSPKTCAVYADRDILMDAIRDLCDTVFGEFRASVDSLLLERTALHADHAELIGEVYPDAHLVHVIRDPHEVVRSLLAQPWGPATVEDAAKEWRASVLRGRAASRHPGYVEIRYEELRADPRPYVERLYESLGLSRTEASIRASMEAATVRVNVAPSAAGPGMGPRKRELSRSELRALERIAGDVVDELGYRRFAPPDRASHRLIARVGGAITRIRRAAKREPRPTATTPNPHSVLWLMDRLVSCAREGRPERAAELLAPDAVVRIGDGATSAEHRGNAARDQLIEFLRRDPVFRWRQVGTDLLPGNPTAGYVLIFEREDGALAERVLIVTAAGDRLKKVAVFQQPGDGARIQQSARAAGEGPAGTPQGAG